MSNQVLDGYNSLAAMRVGTRAWRVTLPALALSLGSPAGRALALDVRIGSDDVHSRWGLNVLFAMASPSG